MENAMFSPARVIVATTLLLTLVAGTSWADPCGMVPPVYIGEGQPITRVGLQQTYVFHKDGVETFVIRPGFTGKVDEFGMLIPFPNPPAVRKVPDHVFPHLAAAVDPPEVVVDLRVQLFARGGRVSGKVLKSAQSVDSLAYRRDEVRVIKKEAVGMYEVVVLAAGSSDALKKWMGEHGYKYPDGMDKVCDEYIEERWCFVAVKTKVGQKEGADPQPAQRDVNVQLPQGSTFDGHVQAMGFRFETEELVVPMRLSAFNQGELRNVVYLMTEGPRKIRSIPEEYVVRQISGEELKRNVTQLLPLRIIGGSEADIPDWQRKDLPAQRDPAPKNAAAKELFAMDLLCVATGELSLAHEEREKELLAIGEALGLRGKEIDDLHAASLQEESAKVVEKGLVDLDKMTLTVVDGDFPREVLSSRNLQFAEYRMPARRNSAEAYDTKINGPTGKKEGVLKLGSIDWNKVDALAQSESRVPSPLEADHISPVSYLALAGLSLVGIGLVWRIGRVSSIASVALLTTLLMPAPAHADPCGMVPPIYTGEGQPITRVGLQQTYVFYKNGVETFVIRPGFTGNVDEFGMLIPFPNPPAVRKVPDHIFPHIAAAVDPPEVVIDLRWELQRRKSQSLRSGGLGDNKTRDGLALYRDEVRVLKQEAVGMYEVAVLEAGSPAALKKWMDLHGYKYPDGMDKACEEYVKDRWCFVAVKTKVKDKEAVDPQPAQREVDGQMPPGSTFDGHVQAMGFRFESDELVVPMRLASFNAGELRNIVYLLTDSPQKIRSIPEEYVVRQVAGEELFRNVTEPLPLRIIGGTEENIPEWQRKTLPQQRNPAPHNAAAMKLFAGDLQAIETGKLTLQHEEKEKDLLAIGERLGLRGGEIDSLNAEVLAKETRAAVEHSLADVKTMTLTVVDGDFPREVLARKNLMFGEYKMPARRNGTESYDAKINGPSGKREGVLKLGAIDWGKVDTIATNKSQVPSQSEVVQTSLVPILAVAGLSLLGIGLVWRIGRMSLAAVVAATCVLLPSLTHADPCGMVPPISVGQQNPITRIGEQKTFVFYKDGVETFVIRPGFEGKTDEFGMLIPFPTPPALRKVPDHVFPHVAAAIDPPEVVVDLRFGQFPGQGNGGFFRANALANNQSAQGLKLLKDEIRVVKEEAVGMYEVAVLEAGSAAALKKWMDKHGYRYPDGMDKVCEEYVDDGWCFVAVKTKVGEKEGADPRPAQREVNAQLPDGAVFDGHVQAMGFRFKTDELVVPMRLSAFNAGELRNIVYLLTDKPQKIRSIPEEYVVRQISGEELHRNITGPLPLRIIGGTEKDIPEWQRKTLPQQRDPQQHNAAARDLFASDLLAVSSGELALAHEEKEKDMLAIGERLGLRGADIDTLHSDAVAEIRSKATSGALDDLKSMTLTVVDGDFPREVLARKNLMFGEYRMPARRNSAESYDVKNSGPGEKQIGNVILGAVDWDKMEAESLASTPDMQPRNFAVVLAPTVALLGLFVGFVGIALRRRFTPHQPTN